MGSRNSFEAMEARMEAMRLAEIEEKKAKAAKRAADKENGVSVSRSPPASSPEALSPKSKKVEMEARMEAMRLAEIEEKKTRASARGGAKGSATALNSAADDTYSSKMAARVEVMRKAEKEAEAKKAADRAAN